MKISITDISDNYLEYTKEVSVLVENKIISLRLFKQQIFEKFYNYGFDWFYLNTNIKSVKLIFRIDFFFVYRFVIAKKYLKNILLKEIKEIENIDGSVDKEITEIITMKLENTQSNIYIYGKRFMDCKFVVLNPIESNLELYDLESINSIDEIKDFYSNRDEGNNCQVNAKERFFVHCSNIQHWIEQNYNWRSIHSNLSLPMLKELFLHNRKSMSSKFRSIYLENLDNYCKENDIWLVNDAYFLKNFCLKYMSISSFILCKFANSELEGCKFLKKYTKLLESEINLEKVVRKHRKYFYEKMRDYKQNLNKNIESYRNGTL